MYKRKTHDIWVLQGMYDTDVWDDVVEYDNYAEARADYLVYLNEEDQYPHRLIKRRVKND